MEKKALSKMSIKELHKLFPIYLTEHKSCWKDWYEEEKEALKCILSYNDLKIYHIGSTALNNIWAKPIIDILIEIPKTVPMLRMKEILISSGYICMSESKDKNRMSFNKGYTENGFADRVFHLHLRFFGDNDELYFRDYMNDDLKLAKEYEKLKLSLWKKYEFDRDAYTNAKGEFVKKYTECAKKEYKGRY